MEAMFFDWLYSGIGWFIVASCSEANRIGGIKISPVKLEYGRYISNKLWNVFRYYLNYSQDVSVPIDSVTQGASLVERYILSKCETVAREMESDLDSFDVEKACQKSTDFLLNVVCDLYSNPFWTDE